VRAASNAAAPAVAPGEIPTLSSVTPFLPPSADTSPGPDSSPRQLQLLAPAQLRRVHRAFAELFPVHELLEPHLAGVLRHALTHPGSLARAQLAYGLGRCHGLAPKIARELAIAIEYFHTASLLFDDMPAMDDARERRGTPCAHLVYGEAATTLGALALITRAYQLLWGALGPLPARRRERGADLTAACLGPAGVLHGQALDLHFSSAGASSAAGVARRVAEVAEHKTVPLVRLPLVLPALVAGAPEAELDLLERLASAWGFAYQILDDFKDCLLCPAESGKTNGRDVALGRPNLPEATGVPAALGRLDACLAEARSVVEALAEARPGMSLPGRLQVFLEGEREAMVDRLPGPPRRARA